MLYNTNGQPVVWCLFPQKYSEGDRYFVLFNKESKMEKKSRQVVFNIAVGALGVIVLMNVAELISRALLLII